MEMLEITCNIVSSLKDVLINPILIYVQMELVSKIKQFAFRIMHLFNVPTGWNNVKMVFVGKIVFLSMDVLLINLFIVQEVIHRIYIINCKK